MEEKFLRREQAAKYINVSQRQLDRYIKDGRVRAFKPYNGKLVLVCKDSLNEKNLKSPVPVFKNFGKDD